MLRLHRRKLYIHFVSECPPQGNLISRTVASLHLLSIRKMLDWCKESRSQLLRYNRVHCNCSQRIFADIDMRSSAQPLAVEPEDKYRAGSCAVPGQGHCVELQMVVLSIKECAFCEDGTIFIVRSQHRLKCSIESVNKYVSS